MKNLVKKAIKIIMSPFVLPDYFAYKKLDTNHRFKINLSDFYPQIKDKTITTNFDRHYVYHLSWAARIISEIKPEKHIDISSSLFFSGLVSAFVPVEFYDYRPAKLFLSNLETGRADLTKLFFEDNSINSLSCMHTVEHIGLGRYGDPVNPDGDIVAAKEIERVLAPNGNLLFVVPVGKEDKIEWNAHRIYTYESVVKMFPNLKLKEFTLIKENDENSGLIRNADPVLVQNENYACGCFLFTK